MQTVLFLLLGFVSGILAHYVLSIIFHTIGRIDIDSRDEEHDKFRFVFMGDFETVKRMKYVYFRVNPKAHLGDSTQD